MPVSGSQTNNDAPDAERLRQALVDAGFEIYRADGGSIVLAERVRMHLMESGVSLVTGSELQITVCVRTQRTDHPGDDAATMLDRVRSAVAATVAERGFAESAAESRDIMHPSEQGNVLDVWHEVTFSRQVEEEQLHDHLRWALALPRCVTS